MIGICLIVGVQALSGIGQQFTAQLALVAAAVCYAGAAIFGQNFKGHDPMLPATGSMLCGAALLFPSAWSSIIHGRSRHPRHSLLALLCLSVFSTALAFTIYFRLLHTLGPVGTTSQAYLRVPIGVAIGVVFLGETLAPTTLAGLVFVVAGVAAMSVPARTAPRGR